MRNLTGTGESEMAEESETVTGQVARRKKSKRFDSAPHFWARRCWRLLPRESPRRRKRPSRSERPITICRTSRITVRRMRRSKRKIRARCGRRRRIRARCHHSSIRLAMARKRIESGGWTRQVTVRELPVSKSIAGVEMRLTAGGVRELHWHVSSEWAIMLYGNARITAVDVAGKSFVSDVGVGDLWLFPPGVPHSIQGLGPDGCQFLLVFDDGNFNEFETFLLTDWLAHTPKEVLAKNFGVSEVDVRQGADRKSCLFFRRDCRRS